MSIIPEPVQTVLTRLKSVRPAGDGWAARCPAHDDGSPSLSVRAGDDGRALLHCHAGCAVESVVKALGLTMRDLFPPAADGGRRRAEADDLNAVYSALLDKLDLSAGHRQQLRARGIADDVEMNRRRYRTLPGGGRAKHVAKLYAKFGDLLLRVPGFTAAPSADPPVTLRGCRGLLVPVRDLQGRVVALKIRPDERKGAGPKYVYLSSTKWGGPGPGATAHVPLGIRAPCDTVRVTEGELKADTAFLLDGTPTISVPGAKNWRPALPALQALQAKVVRVALDADCRANRAVAEALRDLAAALRDAGFVTEIEHWPAGRAKGIDDLLLAGNRPDLAAGGEVVPLVEAICQAAGLRPASTENDGPPRLRVFVDPEEHRVNSEVVEALAAEPTLYQRAGELVRVVVPPTRADGPRVTAAPRIEIVPNPALRDIISRRVEFVKEGKEEDCPIHPPDWCASAVAARGRWPGMRVLTGVVPFPVLCPDGSILAAPGYDAATGLFLHWPGEPPPVPEAPGRADARAAAGELLDVVGDFPLAGDIYRAAWFAALLTPLARPAFAGPAPLFLVDANVRAAGKGLLLEVISRIITGNPFPVISYPAQSKDCEDELRKKITTFVLSGDRIALFDNLTGTLGDGTLDRALTATEWQDRLLGSNRQYRGALDVTFYATGNNVIIRADTSRRICHVRLESPEERPEERSDMKRPRLIEWVAANRQRLLGGALTILRAFHVAGRPDQGLKPWGSFEAWSGLVRNAVVWAGLPDPGETRVRLQDESDEVADALRSFILFLENIDPERHGLTAGAIVGRAADDNSPCSSEVREMGRGAIEGLAGRLDGRKLGHKLKLFRKRVVGGRYIDKLGVSSGSNRWGVRESRPAGRPPASPPSPPCQPRRAPRQVDMVDLVDLSPPAAAAEEARRGWAVDLVHHDGPYRDRL